MNTTQILKDGFLYHIYPLGACGTPKNRNEQAEPCERLLVLENYLDHLNSLGANIIYLGPLFESDSHGYDTRDYFQVDARLGTNQTLKRVSEKFHQQGMRLILDGVFNHVGRGFWAFQDVMAKGQASDYCDWFVGLDFSQSSPYGDSFTYHAWEGHYSLVKLNLSNLVLRQHLLDAVRFWITEFGIDGLRLDAADCVDKDFWRFLRKEILQDHPDFFFLGEIIHGDYRDWANDDMFQSTTNYAAYKGLWSSLNDKNYFEIAYALNQQFGTMGEYAHLPMYNFVDNHDVNRAASQLTNPTHLYLLYGMLFTMPGFPSLYYGSEVGLRGELSQISDDALRPFFDPLQGQDSWDHQLFESIKKFAAIRKNSKALKYGIYQEVSITSEQFAYVRHFEEDTILVVFNASAQDCDVPIQNWRGANQMTDILNNGEEFHIHQGATVSVPKEWLRILRVKR